MKEYTVKDIVMEISERENFPASSPYKRFVGLEHYDIGEVKISRFGSTGKLESAMKIFHKGDILIARRNVYLKRAAVVNFDGLTSGDSIVLRANDEKIKDILPFIFNTDAFWDFANRYADGTMSKRLSPKTLMEYKFSLPEGDELLRLSQTLWAAYDLKESYKRLLVASDEMAKSQFIEMFGDPATNPRQWTLARFNEFALIDAQMTTEYEKYADYPHIGIDSIEKTTGNLVGFRTVKEDNVISGKYLFSEKHIIYSKIRPNLNKVALPNFSGVCSADAYPILPKENCSRVFLAFVMRSDYFLKYILPLSGRSNMPKVNREQLRGFSMPLPPLELQNEFAAFIEQLDKSKVANYALRAIT